MSMNAPTITAEEEAENFAREAARGLMTRNFQASLTDPADMLWPPMLPLELAMQDMPVADICRAYNVTRTQYEKLRDNPAFRAAVLDAFEALRREGGPFKAKARMQAEELLKTSWQMIHAPSGMVPPSVKADLIKFTIRAAGLDGSKDAAAGGVQATALQINIQL